MQVVIRPLVALLAIAIAFGSFAVQAEAATLDSAETELLGAINEFRASKGLPTVGVSDTLTFSAKWMATDMAIQDYFAHTSLDGRSPSQRMVDAGYPASRTWTGENLAAGYSSAREVLQGWIDSPGHYAVLVNPNYRAVGLGRSYGSGSDYGWYWAANFGGVVDAATTASSFDLGYHARFHVKSADPVLAPGQTATVVVALENAGYRGWYVGAAGRQAMLATAQPLDVARPELASGWIAANRPATTTTAYVGPGEVGWFQFQVRAPQTPGVYRLPLRGVVDGTTWLEDLGIVITVTVR